MTKGIQYAIPAVQTLVNAVTGIRAAPTYIPDKIAEPEAVSVCMAGPGLVNYFDGCVYYNPITLRLWITVAHKDTSRNDATMLPYGDSVPAALWASIDLSSTVDSIEAIRIAGYGPWSINGMARFGWAFEIDVRITACV